MDFYTRQAAARRHTRWLLAGFVLALLTVVLALDVVLFTLLAASEYGMPVFAPLEFARLNPGVALFCTLSILAVLGLASLYKSLELRGGGGVVARALGGVRIGRDTADLKLKRLHNVVEEMAIASGVPMPEVYVLEQESGINAFAAGQTPANAAVAVTQGALDRLGRDELQGVIAHEFSHIVNGDMRLNVQLMGWLFGLFVIALIGRTVVRVAPRGRRGAAGLALVALAMVVLGYVGLLAGRILQAAVSRQRERLADASAVQFTRHPEGLKGALLKIAGVPAGSRLGSAGAEQVAHMLFAQGLARAFATHPPLAERIRALDPRFDPRQLARLAAEAARQVPTIEELAAGGPVVSHAVPAQPGVIASQVGHPQTVHVRHAQALRLALPESLREFVESSGRARGLVLALLLSRDRDVRARQMALLARTSDADELGLLEQCAPVAASLAPMLRLPALLQLFPALRRLPQAGREALGRLAHELVRADARIDVFEFCLLRLLATLLQDELQARAPHGRRTLDEVQQPLHVLFATLARAGASDERAARMAYEAGLGTVLPRYRPAFAVIENWPARLDEALTALDELHPFAKQAVVEGLVRTIAHDEMLSVAEAELLRTACALLHCPLPPLLPAVAARAEAPEQIGVPASQTA